MEFIVDYLKTYDYKKMIFPLAIIILYIVGFIYFDKKVSNIKKVEIKENLIIEEPKIEENEIIEYIYVDIKGAIKNPGVYKLEKNSRVIDAINISGGLIKNSNTTYINLSKILNDEETIKIYTNEEIKEQEKENTINKENITLNEQTCICENTINNKININKANEEDLQKLDGIGQAKSKSIIEYRNVNGTFSKIEDIMKVNGISESLFEKIKDFITV